MGSSRETVPQDRKVCRVSVLVYVHVVCMCTCVWAHLHMHVYVHTHISVCSGLELALAVFFYRSPLGLLRQDLSPDPELTNQPTLASQLA